MAQSLVHTPPLAVLVDRSRDGLAGAGLLCLSPGRVFQVAETQGRITYSLLRSFDVLAICGHSADPHTPQEARAIVAFVRRGGRLILAANAGRFEQATGRAARHLGCNALARLFGFEVLTVSDLGADLRGHRGYDRASVQLTPAGRRLGCALGQIRLDRAGPITAPPGAQVLLRHRSGRPIAATADVGRGRVLVCGELAPWLDDYNPWVAAHWVAALAGSSRPGTGALQQASRPGTGALSTASRPVMGAFRTASGSGARALPVTASPGRVLLRRRCITVSFVGRHRRSAKRVLDLAGRVWAEWSRWITPPRDFPGWRITVEPGAGYQHPPEWWFATANTLQSRVGAGWEESHLAGSLTENLGDRLVIDRLPGDTPQFRRGIVFAIRLHVLEALGYTDLAASLRAACADATPGDLGRVYRWTPQPATENRFWLEFLQAFGNRGLRKLLTIRGTPDPYKDIQNSVYTDLDRLAYLLGNAIGPGIYPWLREHGHTVRAIPLHKPGTAAHRRAVKRELERILCDRRETVSQRGEALSAIASSLARDKVALDRCARQAGSPRMSIALPASAHLALSHDIRGAAVLRSFVTGKDDGLAAVVMLILARASRDARALDWLARRAGRFDTRFQLGVGHVLAEAGDSRAGLYSFARLRDCSVRVVEDGFRRISLNVDGQDVANAWCAAQICDMPGGNATATFYVEWVFTLGEWRRRGLARVAMDAALDSDWAAMCATTSLHTGQRNVAHRLYRECGLQDCGIVQFLRKTLRREPVLRPPRGIRIRPAGPRDVPLVREFARVTLADRAMEPGEFRDWRVERPNMPAQVAFAGSTLVGVAAGRANGKKAEVTLLAIAGLPGKDGGPDQSRREQVGVALLSRLHRDLLAPGRDEIRMWQLTRCSTEPDLWILQRAGYGRERGGAVELHRINDLARFLAEIAPLFEQRLRESPAWRDWVGAVLLEGEPPSAGRSSIENGAGPGGFVLLDVKQLCARVAVDHSRIKVGRLSGAVPGRLPAAARGARASGDGVAAADIVVRGDTEAIQRIALGLATPYEEYLQARVRILPSGDPRARDLLEVLFPRVIVNA